MSQGGRTLLCKIKFQSSPSLNLFAYYLADFIKKAERSIFMCSSNVSIVQKKHLTSWTKTFLSLQHQYCQSTTLWHILCSFLLPLVAIQYITTAVCFGTFICGVCWKKKKKDPAHMMNWWIERRWPAGDEQDCKCTRLKSHFKSWVWYNQNDDFTKVIYVCHTVCGHFMEQLSVKQMCEMSTCCCLSWLGNCSKRDFWCQCGFSAEKKM